MGQGRQSPAALMTGERGRGHQQARAVTPPDRGRATLPWLVPAPRRIQDVMRHAERQNRMDRGSNK